MVKLINNVPCRYVGAFNGDIHFILLHKILDNARYRSYYKALSDNKYKILDNGAFELGKSLDIKVLLFWARKLNVNEVIAPDVFGDKSQTLKALKIFIDRCEDRFKIQAVPQGATEEDRMDCLYSMLRCDRVSVIGFNKAWDRHSTKFKALIQMVFNAGKEVHLLGVNNLHDWVSIYDSPYIRSADSRVLSKIVSGVDDTWELKLNSKQLEILQRLDAEVKKWQK